MTRYGKHPTISAIICTYTQARWDLLVAAVASLLRQEHPFSEIIVVVDHNEPMEFRLRRELGAVTVVSNSGPPGLSGARNSGASVAVGEIVAWLDDDAEAARDWSARLLKEFSDPAVVGVGSSVVPRWEDRKPPWFPEEFYWVIGCTYRGVPTVKQPIRNPLGGAMALRKDVLKSVGEFRSDLGRFQKKPLGCEETELCVRIRQRFPHVEIMQNPLARVSHFVPEERASWRYFSSRCLAEGLSKAAVTRAVGSADGLASERGYLLRVLPAGVLRNLLMAFRGDPWGLARAGAIVAGLALTCAGFVFGKLRRRPLPASSSPEMIPGSGVDSLTPSKR